MHDFSESNPLVSTVKDLCRVCYTCVRECPAKAIKIDNGQAWVITSRCIACGICVKVCSQGAKTYYSSVEKVEQILQSQKTKILCLAPSFVAEFSEFDDYKVLIGMIKKLGFDLVTEVSFGADLVSEKYREIFDNKETHSIITSDCPAIVHYVTQYHPDLVKFLAPVISPAMAMAKVVRQKYGEDSQVVFASPCIAKKAESKSFNENITFTELRSLLKRNNIVPDENFKPEFDEPISGKGAFFPVNHGLLKSLDRKEGLGKGDVITAEGKVKFKEAIHEFENGILNNLHLELLCCDGCIEGPGMSVKGQKLTKRIKINEYVNKKLENLDYKKWQESKLEFKEIDLSRVFFEKDRRIDKPKIEEIEKILISMGKLDKKDMLNCGACGYFTCEEHAVAVAEGLAETEMCLPYSIEKLHKSVEDLNETNQNLRNTKQALKQSEKLASMGQVSAGIAHELNNPLGVISLYSSILKDEIDVNSDIYKDIELIDEQAQRCKNIVGGLLNFARKNKVAIKETNIIEFIYKSFDSFVKPDNVKIVFEHQIQNLIVKFDPDQMMQAITNLEKNAVEAMPDGGILSLRVLEEKENVIIEVSDTGIGISQENLEKIFAPFFTTKGVSKGIGLGLSLVYGIVKMHKGKINVSSNNNPEIGPTQTTFRISLPI